MKLIAILSFFILTPSLVKAEWIPPYHIKSDTLNTVIPEGITRVNGLITDYGNNVIGQGIVGTTDFKHQAKVNLDGTFSLDVPSTYRDLFFFAIGHEEVVLYGYIFKSQHEVYIQFLSRYDAGTVELEKPVIYAYSEAPQNVEIALSVMGNLSFTYPQLIEKWEFTAGTNGTINMSNGDKYPYLFWEGEKDQMHYKTANNLIVGYLIKTDTCVKFLENQLDDYGLNQTEKTDFITYWGPRMIQKDFALVQFITDDDYASQIAKINVSPEPNAMLRLFMFFSPLDSPNVKYTPNYNKPERLTRSGLTIVEWGGAEVPLLQP